jgi:hypothetical protein
MFQLLTEIFLLQHSECSCWHFHFLTGCTALTDMFELTELFLLKKSLRTWNLLAGIFLLTALFLLTYSN